MMKSVSILATVLLAANVASAQDAAGGGGDISEFHQHADMGVIEVTPAFEYETRTLKADAGGGEIEIGGFALTVEGEYGISHGLSVGAQVGYQSATNKTTGSEDTDITGMTDLTLFGRGHSDMGGGRLAYGLDLGISLGNAETETNGDMNAMTGGMSATPYVGYEMMAGPGTWGANFRYNWLGERTSEAGGVETKEEGGSGWTIATFYEYDWSAENAIGAALSYTATGETEDEDGTKNGDDTTSIGVKVYAPMKVADAVTLIPSLTWATTSWDDAAGIDSDNTLGLGVAARWNF